jgi:Zn-dependent protease with chaperone function
MVDMGTDVIERIRFYRFSSLTLRVTILAPLAFGVIIAPVMLIVAIAQGRCWIFESISHFSQVAAVLATVGILVVFAGIAVTQVRSRVRRNLKDFYRETDYDQAEYESFKSALEGVSIGLGMRPPVLEVLGIPTVNSIAFREGRKPGVGVTAEALKARLSQSEKEAMMAHEIAHIALGDYFLASSSAAFEYAGYGLGVLFLLMAVLVTIAINVYVLIFLLPLFAPLIVVLADRRLRQKKNILYRHNDLLADTIAAKLLSDPECLGKTIEKLWALSEETRAVIPKTAHFQGYLFISRPLESGPIKMVTYYGDTPAYEAGNAAESGKTRTTKIYWVPGKTESGTSFAYDTAKSRIANLKAIEMGHWTELERPNQHEKIRNIAALGAVGLMMVLVVLALVIPWHGKSLWDYATTNVVWKMIEIFRRSGVVL